MPPDAFGGIRFADGNRDNPGRLTAHRRPLDRGRPWTTIACSDDEGRNAALRRLEPGPGKAGGVLS